MSEKSHSHILIIEDDPGIAASLTSGLEREGFQVSWKDKGEDIKGEKYHEELAKNLSFYNVGSDEYQPDILWFRLK